MVKQHALALIKQDAESHKDVVVLEPFEVRSIRDGRRSFYLEKKIISIEEMSLSQDRFFGKELPFYFVEEAVQPIEYSEFSLSIEGIKKARGGIRLSDNATLYLKVGILWKSSGRYKFYFPYVYRSIVGLGFRRIY
jgi:hypothetical protein